MPKKRKQKIRTDFRKKHESRTRQTDLTRDFREHGFAEDESVRTERVSGKGKLTRKKPTVVKHDLVEIPKEVRIKHKELDLYSFANR